MEARKEFTRLMIWLAQQVDEIDSEQLKADIALLLGAAGQLTTVLADRNTALAKQHRSRKAKPPKSSPAKAPKQQSDKQNSADSSGYGKDAEGRSQGLSRIQQGINQADASMADQRRALLGKVYGAQNDDVAFRKTAKAIAS
ncbi:hypothetical protein RQP55_04025 [Novosphingobium sp. APW14]|uniref:hypothetical protein n=1 Tax=Novosphingobium sp. APW14 TaxID=3077237 RepID=UPI0028DFF32C|nr:hypothetical protein [Novosphingobium sp. APW14]MDT9012597.1 hypothetical protein [Novosphingobium sp. APW14]